MIQLLGNYTSTCTEHVEQRTISKWTLSSRNKTWYLLYLVLYPPSFYSFSRNTHDDVYFSNLISQTEAGIKEKLSALMDPDLSTNQKQTDEHDGHDMVSNLGRLQEQPHSVEVRTGKPINHSPDNKILALSKLKAFADNLLNINANIYSFPNDQF